MLHKWDPLPCDTWAHACGKEFGKLAQGNKVTNTPVTNLVYVIIHKQIHGNPLNRVVMYTQVVVDYRWQKTDPNRVYLTSRGNLVNYPGKLATCTDLFTKIMWNSIISTLGSTQYLCLDIKKFTSEHQWGDLNTWRCLLTSFPQQWLINTISCSMCATAMYILKSVMPFMAYGRLES